MRKEQHQWPPCSCQCGCVLLSFRCWRGTSCCLLLRWALDWRWWWKKIGMWDGMWVLDQREEIGVIQHVNRPSGCGFWWAGMKMRRLLCWCLWRWAKVLACLVQPWLDRDWKILAPLLKLIWSWSRGCSWWGLVTSECCVVHECALVEWPKHVYCAVYYVKWRL